jgi:hypothetical protein
VTSTPSHANLQHAHCTSQPPLTTPNPALLPHTSTSAVYLSQATTPQNNPHQTPTAKDTPFEHTLNALSLFQKPIQLFPEKQLSSTSKSTPSSLPDSYHEDPHNRPTNPKTTEKAHLTQYLEQPCSFPNSTATSSGLNTNSPTKISTPPNKPKSSTNTKRQSPYNIRPPKEPSITPADIPTAPTASSQSPQNNPP